MLLIGFALVAGLLLSPARRLLLNRWLVLGGVVAFVLFLPNILWQVENGWPSLEFYRNATLLKNLPSPPIRTLANQILFMNPVMFPVWAAGLAFVFTRDERNRVAGFNLPHPVGDPRRFAIEPTGPHRRSLPDPPRSRRGVVGELLLETGCAASLGIRWRRHRGRPRARAAIPAMASPGERRPLRRVRRHRHPNGTR